MVRGGCERGGPAMRTDYPRVIAEDLTTLRQRERQLRGRPTAVRVQALRLLKSGVAHSLDACAALVGHSPRQVARWRARYRRPGARRPPGEAPPRGNTPRPAGRV